MPQFTYTAIQADGQRVSGTIESFSLQAAHDALKQMHLIPEEIHESTVSEQPLTPEQAEKLLSFTQPAFTNGMPEETPVSSEITTESPEVPSPKSQVLSPKSESPSSYFPLLDTLRLYAGWLLAWYCLVYALGNYQHTRPLPFRMPFVEGLFLSPLVLSFTLVAYLFLLLTGIWKATGRGIVKGLIATGIGVAGFVLYRMNVL
ncbi:MAG: hypothetical protein PHO20_05320, partial [Candidatus Peribacteraceae bacterium]|nr:hypothetical protein [Candidatus Peribacteraceae bacterium]MDD5740156.1 hypothetical protein [Candidatus Peribacteraceae bacterium]